MPLLSVEFALFFLAFLPIYWGLAKYPSVQNLLLLAAGMGWLYHIGPVFAAIIVLYSSCVYLLGELLRSDRENTRRFWLGCGIAASLTVLGFFKYFDFFRPMIAQYAGKGGAIDILMPLGLSYYTFQSLAYLVYCFRAPHAARFSWHELLLHLSFFPHRYLRPDYPRRRIQKRGRRTGRRIGANPYPPTAFARPSRTRRFPDSTGYCQKMVAGGDAGGKLGIARI